MDRHLPHVKQFLFRIVVLLLLTAAAFLILGYHPYAEDAEIYLPGVLKILNPNLFPTNAQFFGEHAGHTLYPHLIAFSVQASRLALPWVALIWQTLSIFLLLTASWRLASALFDNERARWAGVASMAALLTLPIAGTFLLIHDQYLNPRNLAAFAGLFAVAETLYQKYLRAVLWLAFAAAVHPLMGTFPILFCVWMVLLKTFQPRFLGFVPKSFVALPFGITFAPPPAAYHEVALRQRSHFVLRWEWYEWLGVIGPVLIFLWLGGWARKHGCKNLELISRAMVPFGVVAATGAIGLSSSVRFEALARIQPLRCLALCYMVLIIAGGGLIGQYILQNKVWRWLALFVPLSLGMYFAQRQVFPSSQHIEWPWEQPRNHWAQAFDWIRDNTPVDALFALNPSHMELPGEDENGFRARAQRSMLADLVKDKGAASMFPPLSVDWAEQIDDQKSFDQFGGEDFEHLHQKYGVGWVVVEQRSAAASDKSLDCRYENVTVKVCRLVR
jgi:hypothetical protein